MLVAIFPGELLSLLLDAPLSADFHDEELIQFPSSIRGYLLAWHLVFDSYESASVKVRRDYTAALKTGNYMGPLLEFMFHVLGHSSADAINLDRHRFDGAAIRYYSLWYAIDSEPSERDMQWLLIHLYYLCLKFTPSLVKDWWVDCKSRQTRIAVENWTSKYFSALVVEDTLNSVMEWSSDQELKPDGKELVVKASKRSREILAGYEVDEMMAEIMIRLPQNYPLEGVKVEGVHRVAVSAKDWNGWMPIFLGAITFAVRSHPTTARNTVT